MRIVHKDFYNGEQHVPNFHAFSAPNSHASFTDFDDDCDTKDFKPAFVVAKALLTVKQTLGAAALPKQTPGAAALLMVASPGKK